MTEVISKGISLEISENIAVPFNFSIADYQDFTKRKRNFSKEIVFGDTAVNRAYFMGNFGFTETELGINFDTTQKQSTIVKSNGVVTVPNGVIQLKSVSILNGQVQFKCQIYSETVDLFLLLSSLSLSDIDFSDLNHELSITNIENSWLGTAGTGYYYPLIERGLARPALTTFRTIDLVPYVYLVDVIKRAYSLLGLTISSTFLNSTTFKNILVGYGGGELVTITPTELSHRKITLGSTLSKIDTQYYTFGNQEVVGMQQLAYFNNIFSDAFSYTETTDFLNQHDGGEITVARTGNYSIDIAETVYYDFTLSNGTLNWVAEGFLKIKVNGVVVGTQTQYLKTSLSFTDTYNLSVTVNLNAGDVITWEITRPMVSYVKANLDPCTVQREATSTGSVSMSCLDTTITDGSTVDVSLFLPNVKLSDLVASVFKHFNLYQSDPVEGVVKIEPLTTFYSNTNVFTDITETVDQNKEITIEPTGNNFPKTINFKFKESKDWEFEKYKTKYGVGYGDLSLNQPSYFATGEKTIELFYSTIAPYNIPTTSLILPRFVKMNNNGNLEPQIGNLRVMFRLPMTTGNWTLSNATGSTTSAKTTYPLVHHFNHLSAPTFDLNFELPIEIYSQGLSATNNNAYSTYYAEFVNEQISPAGKMVTLYNDWKNQQIAKLDYGKLIMYKATLWRLQTILDFDRNVNITTKTVLTKVLKAKKPSRKNYLLTYGAQPAELGAYNYEVGQIWEGSIYQLGTANPVIGTVKENTMKVSITALRESAGVYFLSGFTNLGKNTNIVNTNVTLWNDTILVTIFNSTTLKVETLSGGSHTDDILPAPESTGKNFFIKVIN